MLVKIGRPQLKLRFKFGNALSQRRNCTSHFLSGIAGCDVFGAVPIVGNDVDDIEAFDDGLDLFLGELRNEFGMFTRVFEPGMAEDLQTVAFWVIDEEQSDAIIRGKIAGREHLTIAFVIPEGEL